jgi:hypothetical protein
LHVDGSQPVEAGGGDMTRTAGAKPRTIKGGGWISRWIEEHYAQVAQQWAETPGASWGQMARACADAGLLHPGYRTMADYSAWRAAWLRVHRSRGAKPDAAWHMAEEAMRQKGYPELYPKRSLDPFDGHVRPEIPMHRDQHRLLRAVAIKRAQKIPGEEPSIGAVIQELIERHRAELEREAGALHKRELAKKR